MGQQASFTLERLRAKSIFRQRPEIALSPQLSLSPARSPVSINSMNAPRALGIDLGTTYSAMATLDDGGRTRVRITLLDEPRRVAEIARMLGGVELTHATLAHARELVKR